MGKALSLSALLSAIQKNKGYTFYVASLRIINGMVYIGLLEEHRTVKMTVETYSKMKDYIVVSAPQKANQNIGLIRTDMPARTYAEEGESDGI